MKIICTVLLFFLVINVGYAQEREDSKFIGRAILNYVEAFYEADTGKIYESVSKDFTKRGYYLENGEVVEATMTFSQLVSLSKVMKFNENFTVNSPKKVTIFDISDLTASAKVEAEWGIDYFHLAKKDGKWIIMHVLWQEYPSGNLIL